MLILDNIEIINKKKISIRIYGNKNAKYVYILNHGIVSQKESFKPLEKIGGKKYLFISFDGRSNIGSKLSNSRYISKYINDIRDIAIWTKKLYPKKKIIMLGSSAGAANTMLFAKKYNHLVYRSVGWSIPHKINNDDKQEFHETNVSKNKSTSILAMLLLFGIMIFINIDTHVKVEIDNTKSKDFDVVSTKYIWSVWKSLQKSFKAIKWLNKHGKNNVLYIQSELDTFKTEHRMRYLKRNTGNKIDYLLSKEFFHSFQSEKTNKINERIFQTITQWVERNELKLSPIKTIPTQTNRKIDFSFMVSAYNVGAQVKICVDSILQNQSNNYEIILVDDASTDDTFKYIKEYNKNSKIKIIQHKKNGGISKGRDTGIKNAKGEWFVFVDSDDYLSPDFIDNVKIHLNKYHNLYIFRRDKDRKASKKDDAIQKYKRDCCVTSRVWNNAVFKDYDFPVKYRRGLEDWDFHVRRWETFKIKNIMADPDIFYYYTYNPKSLTKSATVYRTRLTQAIAMYSNKETRRVALKYEIYEHYYLHLLMLSKIWFPDQINNVKKIKYKQRLPFKVRLSYISCIIPGLKYLIRKTRKINNE